MLFPMMMALGQLPSSPTKNEVRTARNEVRVERNLVKPTEVGIPFGCGRAFPISQGHDTGSHLDNDTHAWDFRMPEGTPIVAARDGVVRMARGDSTVGACDPKFAPYANYVVVDHGNGYETQYLHFSAVVVRPGETVKQGQLLGFSGNTGWSCGAHLHFKVARADGPTWNNVSVPATIEGYGDPLRDTLIAAPACPNTNLVASGTGGGSTQMPSAGPSTSPVADGTQQAAGGVPRGADAVIERFQKTASQQGDRRVEVPASREPRVAGSAPETR